MGNRKSNHPHSSPTPDSGPHAKILVPCHTPDFLHFVHRLAGQVEQVLHLQGASQFKT